VKMKPMRCNAMTLWRVKAECPESKYGFVLFYVTADNPDFGLSPNLIEKIRRVTDLPIQEVEYAGFHNDRVNEIDDLRSKLKVTESRLRRAEADFAEAKHGWSDNNFALDC